MIDISAIKYTDTDANTDIAAQFNYSIFNHTDDQSLVVHCFIYLLHTQFMAFLCNIQIHIVLNGEDRPKSCSSKYQLVKVFAGTDITKMAVLTQILILISVHLYILQVPSKPLENVV